MRARRTTARSGPLVAALAASLLTAAVPAVASHDGTGPHARASDDACPPGEVQPAHFFDVPDDGVHSPAVDCLVWYDVASGRSPLEYLPDADVTRAQMARFVRALVERSGGQLPEPTRDHFSDDNGTLHEDSINRVAQARIVSGRGDGWFAPDGRVERGQMATFLVNAYEYRAQRELPAPGADAFSDDDGTVHEDSTDRAAEAGFVAGTGEGRYTPAGLVRRDQMASFLVRVLDLLVEEGRTTPPRVGAGDFDLAFGDRGTAAVPFSASAFPRDFADEVLPVADGKTVVVGSASGESPTQVALARLDADGALDPTFGDGGTVTTDLSDVPGGATFPRAAAVQPDGRIVVAAYADSDGGREDGALLLRYTADGALDPTFGGDGVLITAPVFAQAVAVQSDGRVVIAGSVRGAQQGTRDIALTRYLSDGSPDPSFGDSGSVVTDVLGQDDTVGALLVQDDGRIVVAGGSAEDLGDPAATSYPSQATLVRYLPDGTTDSAFGEGGVVRADTGRGRPGSPGYDELTGVVVGADGALTAVGLSRRDTDELVFDTLLVRYDASGAPDPAFDGDGIALSALAPSSRAADVALDAAGRLVVAGRGSQADRSPYEFLVLARYTPDGRLDDAFGDAGVVRSGLGDAAAVAVTDAGIHVLGTDNQPFQSRSGRPSTMLLSRFVAEDPLSR